MSLRQIIKIDQNKCNGCGLCIPNCPEGAIQIIDKKAYLISDLFCDGLGACIGHCPQGAISIEQREAEDYDERKVMANIVKQGKNVIKAHLEHLRAHKQEKYLKEAEEFLQQRHIKIPESAVDAANLSGCPGSRTMDFRKINPQSDKTKKDEQFSQKRESELRQWPIQLMLVSPLAPYLRDSDLLIAADCVAFACADFHRDFLRGKTLLVGCPKLDNLEIYQEKLEQILEHNSLKSITYAHMEVPCCFGLINIIKTAIALSGKKIPFQEIIIGIQGERLQ